MCLFLYNSGKHFCFLTFMYIPYLLDSSYMNVYMLFLVTMSPANDDIVRLIGFCMETKCKWVSLNGFANII